MSWPRLLPARLAAAAAALANATHAVLGIAATDSVLDLLPEDLRERTIDLAQTMLDAAAAADLLVDSPLPGIEGSPVARISLTKNATLALKSQGAILFDIAADGTVHTTTWTHGAGTPSRALAEWADGLRTHAVSAVPFQTVFGMGFGGLPTPLTPEQLASLSEAGRAYAHRNTVSEEPQP